jgi:hypothetical protein
MEQHKESLTRQHALQDHAIAFGWRSDRILVTDEDLGLSGLIQLAARQQPRPPGF